MLLVCPDKSLTAHMRSKEIQKWRGLGFGVFFLMLTVVSWLLTVLF